MAATPSPAFFSTLKVCAREDRRRLAFLVLGVSQLLSAMEELVLRLGRPIIDRRSAPLLTQLAPGEWGETFAAARRATGQMKAIPAPHRTNTPRLFESARQNQDPRAATRSLVVENARREHGPHYALDHRPGPGLGP